MQNKNHIFAFTFYETLQINNMFITFWFMLSISSTLWCKSFYIIILYIIQHVASVYIAANKIYCIKFNPLIRVTPFKEKE